MITVIMLIAIIIVIIALIITVIITFIIKIVIVLILTVLYLAKLFHAFTLKIFHFIAFVFVNDILNNIILCGRNRLFFDFLLLAFFCAISTYRISFVLLLTHIFCATFKLLKYFFGIFFFFCGCANINFGIILNVSRRIASGDNVFKRYRCITSDKLCIRQKRCRIFIKIFNAYNTFKAVELKSYRGVYINIYRLIIFCVNAYTANANHKCKSDSCHQGNKTFFCKEKGE